MKLSEVIAASHLSPRVTRAVVRQFGGLAAFLESAPDIARHGAGGGWPGFTYYSDTVPFARRHRADILDSLSDLAEDCYGRGANAYTVLAGVDCLAGMAAEDIAAALYQRGHDDAGTVYNALAWYALEEVARAVDDVRG